MSICKDFFHPVSIPIHRRCHCGCETDSLKRPIIPVWHQMCLLENSSPLASKRYTLRWMRDKTGRGGRAKGRIVCICTLYGVVHFSKSGHVRFMSSSRFSLWDMRSMLTSRGLSPYLSHPQRLWGIQQCLQLQCVRAAWTWNTHGNVNTRRKGGVSCVSVIWRFFLKTAIQVLRRREVVLCFKIVSMNITTCETNHLHLYYI